MKKNNLKLTSIFLLVLGLSISSFRKEEKTDYQKGEKTETLDLIYKKAKADFEATPRRCRIVKRYRAKGEVSRVKVTIDIDVDELTISAKVENKPNGFGGYIEFEFLELNGKPLSCTGPIKLSAIKSKGKTGKEIEFESEEIETKNNGICGTTDQFIYPVNINYYNSNGKLVLTQNTTFNLKSNFDGKGKKEEIFESSQVLSGAYKPM